MDASLSPHIIAGHNSPLSSLLRRALAQYGDMAASTAEADVLLLGLDWANQVIDDIRQHPYYDNYPELRYYVSAEDTRPVSDALMISGLLAKYAIWQDSKRQGHLEARYFAKLNEQLFYSVTGGSVPLDMQTVDQGVA